MKLRELKEWINSVSEEDLEKTLSFTSEYESGLVYSIEFAKEDLYWLGDDDPSQLYTKKELIEDNYLEEDEIDNLEIEIHKGDPIISI